MIPLATATTPVLHTCLCSLSLTIAPTDKLNYNLLDYVTLSSGMPSMVEVRGCR